MAKVCVYAELSDGKLNSAVPEIMARARELGDVSVVALGTGAKEAAATLGKHGAKVAYVKEDNVFDDYLAEPATDVMHALQQQDAHDLILFSFTTDSRDIAGRLAARLGTSLISNASDITAEGGSFVAKVPYFGGAKVASMKANGKPAIVLIRPKSFEASETGGSADVKDAPGSVGDGSKRAHILERVAEASEKVKLEDARVVISGGRGMGGPDNFPLLEDLAGALGGAVGASRAVVYRLPPHFEKGTPSNISAADGGSQRSTRQRNIELVNCAGATPTIVNSRSFTFSVWPTAAGSAPR